MPDFTRLFLLLWLACASCIVRAGTLPDTLVLDDREVHPISEHLYWLRTEHTLDATTAYQQFKSGSGARLSPAKGISSGVSPYYYWFTFSVTNTSSAQKEVVYEFNYPFINTIEIYTLTATGFKQVLKTGAGLPFLTRRYPYHDFVYPITLGQGETKTFLIRAERIGDRFSTTPQLVDAAYFKKNEQRAYTILGVIMGIMMFNVLINLFLGISLREKIHYLYALYVLAALAWVLGSVGLNYQFFFPDHPTIFYLYQFFTAAVTMVLMTQLSIEFLDLKDARPKVYYILQACKWVIVGMVVLRIGTVLFSVEPTWLKRSIGNIYMLAIGSVAIGIVWAAIIRIKQGNKPAWFFLTAICFLAISIFVTCYIILTTNDLSILVQPPTYIQLGLVIESLVIFAGIIYRYAHYKREKNDLAIKLANQKLEMTGNIITAQEEERKRLAQDLHDDLGATLSTLLLHLTNQTSPVSPESHAYSIAITQKALVDLRHISHDLLPKDFSSLKLFQALSNRVDELNTFAETRFWINVDGNDDILSEIQAITFYRITNELINNTIKHACAAQANIDFFIADDSITLTYDDDGVGFTQKEFEAGIGLKNIYSRVAYLGATISVDPNRQGTTIIIVAPLRSQIQTDGE